MTPRRWMLLWAFLFVAPICGLLLQQRIHAQQESDFRTLFSRIQRGMDLEEVEEIMGPGLELVAIGQWGAEVQWKKNGCVVWVQVGLNAQVREKKLTVPVSRTFLQWLRSLFR
ncbi:MAG TPA: hypothetical protein VKE98_01240 [Gemmataceae bacterium]|nr:hypothetical protein [Gemmataceae bacterium]